MTYDETHDAVEDDMARVLEHAMRFAEYSMEGPSRVAFDVLPELVKACEAYSAARAMLSLRTRPKRRIECANSDVSRESNCETAARVAVAPSQPTRGATSSTEWSTALVDTCS